MAHDTPMELTKLKSIISNRLENLLLKNVGKKRRLGNGSSAGALTSTLKSRSNSGSAGAVKVQRQALDQLQEFEARHNSEEWVLRSHMNDLRFKVSALVGKEVVFCILDAEDNFSEYRGVVEGNFSAGSALFKLEGREQIFNSNFLAKIAVAQ